MSAKQAEPSSTMPFSHAGEAEQFRQSAFGFAKIYLRRERPAGEYVGQSPVGLSLTGLQDDVDLARHDQGLRV
jgi:hypothetical protein